MQPFIEQFFFFSSLEEMVFFANTGKKKGNIFDSIFSFSYIISILSNTNLIPILSNTNLIIWGQISLLSEMLLIWTRKKNCCVVKKNSI